MRRRTYRHVLLLLSIVFWLAVPGVAARSGEQPPDPAAQARLRTFELVWQTVNEKFFDPEFNGVDWKAVRERYAPKVAALGDDASLYPLLNEMLGELGASHFALLPPETGDVAEDMADDDSWGGDAGFSVRILDGRAIVTEVVTGSPAAQAGIRMGFAVTRAGSAETAKVVKHLQSTKLSPSFQRLQARRALTRQLQGLPGTDVEVVFENDLGESRAARIQRIGREGRPVKFGELPSMLTVVTSRRLENGVGYVRFNVFLPPMMDEIRAGIQSLKDAPAIIVDLRGNPGGVGGMAPAIASMFLPREQSLGTMKFRKGEVRFLAFKRPDSYSGPLVILTDESSASTSEIFAGALQEIGRAVVVGERSAGAVLPSVIQKLPNGARFQYAVADFRTPKGVLLEGRGVLPDIAVNAKQRDYLGGRDPVFDAALKYLDERLSPAAATHSGK